MPIHGQVHTHFPMQAGPLHTTGTGLHFPIAIGCAFILKHSTPHLKFVKITSEYIINLTGLKESYILNGSNTHVSIVSVSLSLQSLHIVSANLGLPVSLFNFLPLYTLWSFISAENNKNGLILCFWKGFPFFFFHLRIWKKESGTKWRKKIMRE